MGNCFFNRLLADAGGGAGGGSHLRDQGGEGEGKSVKTWED